MMRWEFEKGCRGDEDSRGRRSKAAETQTRPALRMGLDVKISITTAWQVKRKTSARNDIEIKYIHKV